MYFIENNDSFWKNSQNVIIIKTIKNNDTNYKIMKPIVGVQNIYMSPFKSNYSQLKPSRAF